MIRATAVQAFELDEVSNSRYNGSVTLSSALAIARHTSNRRPPAYALTQITEDWGSHDPALDGNVSTTGPFVKLPTPAQRTALEEAAEAEKSARAKLIEAAKSATD